MSDLLTATPEGINIDSLSTQEHNALNLLENLPLAEVNHLEQLMDLPACNTIDSMMLEKFLKFCFERGLDFSEAGVNAFKNQHKLGNTGAVKGVIGPQTAQVYYEILSQTAQPSLKADRGIRTINQAGLHLIEEFEGLAKKLPDGKIAAYPDAVHVPTIGYGHTKGVYLGMVISCEQAESFLQEDLRVAEAAVSHLVKVSLNDNQFSALVSFVFNLGAGALSGSTLLRELNAGNYQAAADQFLRWTRAGGQVLQGLVRRRQAEQKLFLS